MPNGINEPEQLAFAKLTLHLHVTGLRDDGYHLLDSEMVSLDLADRLTFSAGDGLEVMGSASASVPSGGDNLVARALAMSGRRARIALEKNIPPGAGLGGGSSDAAAVLRWAGVTDTAVAARIGSDVPFCLSGGRARVGGVGEVLEPLPYSERTFTLLVPPFGVNTAAVYQVFDELGRRSTSEANSLEGAALVVEPRLAEFRSLLQNTTGQIPTLAGSGSTWFVEGEWTKPTDEILGKAKWVVARTTRAIALE